MRVGRWASNPPRKKTIATETPNMKNPEQTVGEPGAAMETQQMTSGDQSREEVSTPTESLAKPKHQVRVAAWNVNTMYQTGKTAQVVKEMKRYSIGILGISEMRWTESGIMTINSGETVCYSGLHQEGVGIMDKKSRRSLMGWEPVNERIIRARFYSKFAKTTVIQCYAPTELATEEEKDIFYGQLQDELDKTPRHDILLLMGDFNAKVGGDNEGFEGCIGREGMGERNGNGQRFAELCMENGMVIGGTVFQHKDIHKLTWISPDGRTRNQIDHIAINQKWRGSMTDVRALRGADVGSDHLPVLCKIRLKLKRVQKQQGAQLFDSSRLRDATVKSQFTLELKNRFQILEDTPADDINQLCSKIEKVFTDTSEEILGHRKKERKEWISEGTWKLIEERTATKQLMITGIEEDRADAAVI